MVSIEFVQLCHQHFIIAFQEIFPLTLYDGDGAPPVSLLNVLNLHRAVLPRLAPVRQNLLPLA